MLMFLALGFALFAACGRSKATRNRFLGVSACSDKRPCRGNFFCAKKASGAEIIPNNYL